MKFKKPVKNNEAALDMLLLLIFIISIITFIVIFCNALFIDNSLTL